MPGEERRRSGTCRAPPAEAARGKAGDARPARQRRRRDAGDRNQAKTTTRGGSGTPAGGTAPLPRGARRGRTSAAVWTRCGAGDHRPVDRRPRRRGGTGGASPAAPETAPAPPRAPGRGRRTGTCGYRWKAALGRLCAAVGAGRPRLGKPPAESGLRRPSAAVGTGGDRQAPDLRFQQNAALGGPSAAVLRWRGAGWPKDTGSSETPPCATTPAITSWRRPTPATPPATR